MSSLSEAPQLSPVKIELRRISGVLAISWQDGLVQELDAYRLRSSCRCAGCSAERLREEFRPAADVRLEDVQPFGSSGLQLFFSDGHSRGLFPWRYLRELGNNSNRPLPLVRGNQQ